MRPAPIPEDAVWEGARRVVMSAPNGDLTDSTIAPVEAVLDRSEATGALVYSVRCVLEPGDLKALQEGGHIWVSFYGGMPPFSVSVSTRAGQLVNGAEED
jgi:hypothetical protein